MYSTVHTLGVEQQSITHKNLTLSLFDTNW